MGNLRHVGLPDGRTIDYVIDGLNRRVAKKVNGSVVRKWVYSDGLIPAAEFDGSGNLVSRFAGTEYMVQGSTTYRIVKDHLGSPRLIVNATSGAVAQRLDYDEWGNVTVSGTQSAGWQPFGFAGGIFDPDTGLVRFGARDYDATVGRWTAKDPIRFGGRQANLYGYVLSNPTNVWDSTGLTVYLCRAPTDNAILNFLGQEHYWLKTDTKEAGISDDPGESTSSGLNYGVPISVYDESGHAEAVWNRTKKNACEEVPDVDEDIVNSHMPGPNDDPIPWGNWAVNHNCQDWAAWVLWKARGN
jgi:RHS repeat-associated protein